jgi:predicted acetyltransferase
MDIVPIAPEHEAGLLAFLDEFDRDGAPIPAYFAPRGWSVERIAAQHAKEERGEVEDPIVPASTRFAVEGGAVLGVVNVRHVVNDRLRRYGGHIGYSTKPSARGRGVATALLRHGVALLRARGVAEILVTCDPDNLASRTVIERCGGVEFEREFLEEHGHEVCRFRIGAGS